MLLADLGAEVIKVERPGIGDIARALEPIISEALKKKTTQERLAEFEPIGMPCGPLNGIADTAVDPLLDSRNIFVDLPLSGDVKGAMRVVKTPMKFSRTQAGPDRERCRYHHQRCRWRKHPR